jgi:hypothetical protein
MVECRKAAGKVRFGAGDGAIWSSEPGQRSAALQPEIDREITGETIFRPNRVRLKRKLRETF